MFKVALKNVLGHKVRVLLTAVAVVAGVAFMAGTFVLTDTIKQGFDDLFTDANQGVDAVIRQKAAFEVSGGFVSDQRDEIPLALLPTIAAVDGVASADASIQGFAFIIDEDGTPLNPPEPGAAVREQLALVTGHEPLRPGRRASRPTGPNEAVIDKGSAEKGDIAVGDTIRVQTLGGTDGADGVGHRHLRRRATTSSARASCSWTSRQRRRPSARRARRTSCRRTPRRASPRSSSSATSGRCCRPGSRP